MAWQRVRRYQRRGRLEAGPRALGAFVRAIFESGRHLLQLIGGLLDLSKIEAGRMTLEYTRFDVANAVRDALSLVEVLAGQKRIMFTAGVEPDLPTITTDEAKFREIMYNLLSNAIKFTPDEGRVKVIAGLESQAGGTENAPWLRVSVVDTGVGIKAEDQERVFEAFEQVPTSDARAKEGTGLGLMLTKKLVELQGGRIWVESKGVAGQGSTFAFVIPIKPQG